MSWTYVWNISSRPFGPEARSVAIAESASGLCADVAFRASASGGVRPLASGPGAASVRCAPTSERLSSRLEVQRADETAFENIDNPSNWKRLGRVCEQAA